MVVFGVTHTLSRWDFDSRKYLGDIGKAVLLTTPIAALFWYSGKLFVDTPGDYFVAILFSFLITFPLLIELYKRDKMVAVVVGFLLDLAFELSAPMLPYWMYRICFLRYLFVVMLGIYIGDTIRSGDERPRWDIAILGIASASMLFTGAYTILPFRPEWIQQNLFTIGYAALCTLIAVEIIHWWDNRTIGKIFSIVGKHIYEIFLVQLVVFGILGEYYQRVDPVVLAGIVILAGISYGIIMNGLADKIKRFIISQII